jgi:hypothetical protein
MKGVGFDRPEPAGIQLQRVQQAPPRHQHLVSLLAWCCVINSVNQCLALDETQAVVLKNCITCMGAYPANVCVVLLLLLLL